MSNTTPVNAVAVVILGIIFLPWHVGLAAITFMTVSPIIAAFFQ